jgi:SAM-dependent methyltransferase
VRVERAEAEALPFEDEMFDAAFSQLVDHFMGDPLEGLREKRRVTKPGGVVAACVWDHGGGHGPLGVFWEAARVLDADVDDESSRVGTRQGHLTELLAAAGVHDVTETALSIEVEHQSFEEWWEPFTLGVGPAGAFVARLGPAQRDQLRELCRERLPQAPFVVSARAGAGRPVAWHSLRPGGADRLDIERQLAVWIRRGARSPSRTRHHSKARGLRHCPVSGWPTRGERVHAIAPAPLAACDQGTGPRRRG